MSLSDRLSHRAGALPSETAPRAPGKPADTRSTAHFHGAPSRGRAPFPPEAWQARAASRSGQLMAEASGTPSARARDSGACPVAVRDEERNPALGNVRQFPCRPRRHFLAGSPCLSVARLSVPLVSALSCSAMDG